MQIVLASGSPRRKELLRYLCAQYEVDPADVDETIPTGLTPEQAVQHLAQQKAACVQLRHPDALVIGADTIVVVDHQILGKPIDPSDAIRMLTLLSGRVHQVYTGVALCLGSQAVQFAQCTQVQFYPLEADEIAEYVRTGEPMDKAGAYGIQGWGSTLVERIDGDFFNVMGLPVARLRREMATVIGTKG